VRTKEDLQELAKKTDKLFDSAKHDLKMEILERKLEDLPTDDPLLKARRDEIAKAIREGRFDAEMVI